MKLKNYSQSCLQLIKNDGAVYRKFSFKTNIYLIQCCFFLGMFMDPEGLISVCLTILTEYTQIRKIKLVVKIIRLCFNKFNFFSSLRQGEENTVLYVQNMTEG